MTKKTYTAAEHRHAQRLFAQAKSRGTLKPPRALGALATSNGLVRSYSASSVTYRDYLPDARRALAPRLKPLLRR
jgi:hypothetical protein